MYQSIRQLATLVIVNQPKKCQQNLQFVEEEGYGLKDEKNDRKRKLLHNAIPIQNMQHDANWSINCYQSHTHITSVGIIVTLISAA